MGEGQWRIGTAGAQAEADTGEKFSASDPGGVAWLAIAVGTTKLPTTPTMATPAKMEGIFIANLLDSCLCLHSIRPR